MIDEAARVPGRNVPGNAAGAGGGGRRFVANEHAERQAWIFLGGMGARDGKLGADLRTSDGMSADFGEVYRRGAGERGAVVPAGGSLPVSGYDDAVFPRELIDSAFEDFPAVEI